MSISQAWRRIAIPAKKPLGWLAETILDAFDFDYDHLYEFSYKDHFGRI
ncbi:MAG: IS1096 element passenger TnpR family protein, partial [Nostoc sp.]